MPYIHIYVYIRTFSHTLLMCMTTANEYRSAESVGARSSRENTKHAAIILGYFTFTLEFRHSGEAKGEKITKYHI
jgi:hypothetical protein